MDIAPSMVDFAGALPLEKIQGRSGGSWRRAGIPRGGRPGSMNTITRNSFPTRRTSAAFAPKSGNTSVTRMVTARRYRHLDSSITRERSTGDANLARNPAQAAVRKARGELARMLAAEGLTPDKDKCRSTKDQDRVARSKDPVSVVPQLTRRGITTTPFAGSAGVPPAGNTDAGGTPAVPGWFPPNSEIQRQLHVEVARVL
jgi:hypothetical protein